MSLQARSFLRVCDQSAEEIATLLQLAQQLKAELRGGTAHPRLRGQTLGMIFQKNSTRTRVSFEVGMAQLGGQALFLSSQDLQLHRGESVADTARVLGRYLDGIMARTYSHDDVEALARWSGVPVINGLSDLHHPCQALADLQTIQEKKGRLAGIRLAYVGDSNNVTNSLMEAGALTGMEVRVGSPDGYQPAPDMLAQLRALAERHGGAIRVVADPVEAVRGADVVYTDTWASMGQEGEHEQRVRALSAYRVNAALFAQAAADALFMHCLPAHRGEEVTDDVMDGPRSVVFDQAENRLHAQKALLAALMTR